MKKIWLAALLVAGSVVGVRAQDDDKKSSVVSTTTTTTTVTSSSVSAVQDDKVQIKTEELPDEVKKALANQDYKGWIINTAYHDKKRDKYIVELKNGADTKTVTFDKEGRAEKD